MAEGIAHAAAGVTGHSGTPGRASIEINGQRVPLTPEGIERAQREHGNVGEKIADAVRTAVETSDG
jgi:hypothetical protein